MDPLSTDCATFSERDASLERHLDTLLLNSILRVEQNTFVSNEQQPTGRS